jgi:hypothetical protein
MVKVFAFNKNGKLEFTKEELEQILNEAWNDGYNKGYYSANRLPYYTYTSPETTANPNWWDNVKLTRNNTEEKK